MALENGIAALVLLRDDLLQPRGMASQSAGARSGSASSGWWSSGASVVVTLFHGRSPPKPSIPARANPSTWASHLRNMLKPV